MTPEERALRALADEATPRPWRWHCPSCEASAAKAELRQLRANLIHWRELLDPLDLDCSHVLASHVREQIDALLDGEV